MTVQGMSSREIALRHSLSPRTVETHRENLMKKLGVRTKVELIHYAFRNGHMADP